ncbi:MAG TPA: PIG-L family deacetylase [Polyangia bacterium]|nr:PIG-L family deacetylase [Polyangia bacterium]
MLDIVLGRSGAPLRILCLGAHCDDIEIGCGGTVLRLLAERPGSTVSWLVFSSNAEREREARAAAAEFLADAADKQIIIKQFRDGYLPFQGVDVKDVFEATKRETRPDLILTPHRHDRHQDHRFIAELTWNTYRDHLIAEYEIPKYEGDLGQPNFFVPLADATARKKIDLIVRSFPSQAGRSWFRPETFEAVLRLRGIECNAVFAEAFHAPKVVI